MSQFPNDPMQDEIYAEPDRTSALAIISLILACTCLLSPLGFLGGIGAMVGIGMSRGRVGGRGLAVAAIVVGGLLSAGLIGAGIAVRSGIAIFEQQLVSTGELFMEIEAGDADAVSARFTSSVGERITAARVESFRAAYTADYGAFVSTPTDIGSYWSSVTGGAAGAPPPPGGTAAAIPVTLTFDNGTAFALLGVPQQNATPGPTGFPLLTDLSVVLADGSIVSILDDPVEAAPGDAGADADADEGESP